MFRWNVSATKLIHFTVALVFAAATCLAFLSASGVDAAPNWMPQKIPIASDWAKSVNPAAVATVRDIDHPRPSLKRERGSWVSLNGIWEFDGTCIAPRNGSSTCMTQNQFDEYILVPFPVESSLSGIRALPKGDWVGYRREVSTKTLPTSRSKPSQSRYLLHIESCDWECYVYINDELVGKHSGGYDAFSFDVSEFITLNSEKNDSLVILAYDPTERGPHGRGKQQSSAFSKPQGTFYTSTTGLWDTVWIEAVPSVHFVDSELHIVPNSDKRTVTVSGTINDFVQSSKLVVHLEIFNNRKATQQEIAKLSSSFSPLDSNMNKLKKMRSNFRLSSSNNVYKSQVPNQTKFNLTVKLPETMALDLWSPTSPTLYTLRAVIEMSNAAQSDITNHSRFLDELNCTLGFRKVALGDGAITGEQSARTFYLNDEPLFQSGVLYQGFWPESIYSHPSSEAMKSDLVAIKMLGFNMVRVHVKVESRRWYHFADEIGLLVWQDLPSRFTTRGGDKVDESQWMLEATRLRNQLLMNPCIVQWQLFNEGWGQPSAPQVSELVRQFSSNQFIVNDASGGICETKTGFPYNGGCFGSVTDVHHYPAPPKMSEIAPAIANNSAGVPVSTTLVLGEYGGVEFDLPDHMWANNCFGYATVHNSLALGNKIRGFFADIKHLCEQLGMSGSVYTQLNDVESECNGLMSYDRQWKCDVLVVQQLNQDLIQNCSQSLRKHANDEVVIDADGNDNVVFAL